AAGRGCFSSCQARQRGQLRRAPRECEVRASWRAPECLDGRAYHPIRDRRQQGPERRSLRTPVTASSRIVRMGANRTVRIRGCGAPNQLVSALFYKARETSSRASYSVAPTTCFPIGFPPRSPAPSRVKNGVEELLNTEVAEVAETCIQTLSRHEPGCSENDLGQF